MNDDANLIDRFEAALTPTAERLDAMEDVVLVGFAIVHRSLAAEWAELLRAAPIQNTALVAVAAVAVLATLAPLAALLAVVPLA